jgi:hypothetical protein
MFSPSVGGPVADLVTDGVHPALHFHAGLGLKLVCPLRHDDPEDELHFLLIMGALGGQKRGRDGGMNREDSARDVGALT